MKRMFAIVTLALALGPGQPAPAGEPAIDPALIGAAEKLLAAVPPDFYMVEPSSVLMQMENTRSFLLDVRERGEVAEVKLAGAVNIPLRDLPKAIARLPEDKSTPIFTYCRAGFRGGIAMTILRMWGYTNVRTIKGGLEAWTKAGLPVDKRV